MADTRTAENPLSLGERRRPTKGHRAAVWEAIFGTVYAANRDGEVRYFDYDYAAAIEFADLDGCDLRTYRNTWRLDVPTGVHGPERPGLNQLVLWRRVP